MPELEDLPRVLDFLEARHVASSAARAIVRVSQGECTVERLTWRILDSHPWAIRRARSGRYEVSIKRAVALALLPGPDPIPLP